MLFYNNDKDNTVDIISNDWLINDNHLSSPHDELLMSMAFPQHSFMAKYFHEYATMKGFSPLEHTKDCFTSNQFSNLFSGESNHSLVIDNWG